MTDTEKKKEDPHRYDDIIHLPHPVSKRHPRMSIHDRAAQFAPFAALTGHAAQIEETAREAEERIRKSEEGFVDPDLFI